MAAEPEIRTADMCWAGCSGATSSDASAARASPSAASIFMMRLSPGHVESANESELWPTPLERLSTSLSACHGRCQEDFLLPADVAIELQCSSFATDGWMATDGFSAVETPLIEETMIEVEDTQAQEDAHDSSRYSHGADQMEEPAPSKSPILASEAETHDAALSQATHGSGRREAEQALDESAEQANEASVEAVTAQVEDADSREDMVSGLEYSPLSRCSGGLSGGDGENPWSGEDVAACRLPGRPIQALLGAYTSPVGSRRESGASVRWQRELDKV